MHSLQQALAAVAISEFIFLASYFFLRNKSCKKEEKEDFSINIMISFGAALLANTFLLFLLH